MGADPVWCFFRVLEKDSRTVEAAYQKILNRLLLTKRIQDYLGKYYDIPMPSEGDRGVRKYVSLYEMTSTLLAELDEEPEIDWDNLHDSITKLYPFKFERLFQTLWGGVSPAISVPFDDSIVIIEHFPKTWFVGELLRAELGGERASQIPGYRGNLFIPAERVTEVLTHVNNMFIDVYIGGLGGNPSGSDFEDKLSALPDALQLVREEGHSLLALEHSHMGDYPFYNTDC